MPSSTSLLPAQRQSPRAPCVPTHGVKIEPRPEGATGSVSLPRLGGASGQRRGARIRVDSGVMKALHRKELYGWSVFDEARNLDFHSVLWVRPEGNVVIDPLPLSTHDAAHLRSLGGVAWVVVTNSDHVRTTRELVSALGAKGGGGGEGGNAPLDLHGSGKGPPALLVRELLVRRGLQPALGIRLLRIHPPRRFPRLPQLVRAAVDARDACPVPPMGP